MSVQSVMLKLQRCLSVEDVEELLALEPDEHAQLLSKLYFDLLHEDTIGGIIVRHTEPGVIEIEYR